METYLINLDRSPDRLAEFTARNPHVLPIHRFAGIDGKTVSRAELVERGLFTAEVPYTDGAVGGALSHLALWDMAIARNSPLTVIEDDAIFNRNFLDEQRALLDTIEANWHIILWGYNFDSPLLLRMVPHISPFWIYLSQSELRKHFDEFQQATVRSRAFKLVQGCGFVCYSVSPQGARILKSFCLPIREMQIDFWGLNRRVRNETLDIMSNAIYAQINAYACFPPLVVTPNDHETSLIQQPQQPSPMQPHDD